jgi:hypothetical protein
MKRKIEITSNGLPLSAFIEQNDKLLSALAVFSGLVAFSKEFTPSWLGAAIAFCFLGGLVLVAWELRGKFPQQVTWSLFLFRYVILWGMGGITIYWLYTYRIFWDITLWIPLTIIIYLLVTSTLLEMVLAFRFTRIVFGFGVEKRNGWQQFALLVAIMIIAAYSLTSGISLSVGTNVMLDLAKQIWH